mgnify:CR=1 FL=1
MTKELNKLHNVLSKKISKNKNYMLPGIYEATELIVSRAITQDDYNKIEEALKNLVDFDNSNVEAVIGSSEAMLK